MDDWLAAVRLAAHCLEDEPSPSLQGAIGDIAEWIRQYEGMYQCSSIRSDYRDRLMKTQAAAGILAEALDRAKRPARTVADQELNQTLVSVLAQWVAREGGLDSKPLRALSQGLGPFIRGCAGAGNYRVSDLSGAPRGRMFCAVAAVDLWEAVYGELPGRSNIKLHDLCEALWTITEKGDPEGRHWDRQVRDVLEAAFADLTTVLTIVVGAQIATAHDQIRSILNGHGYRCPSNDLDMDRLKNLKRRPRGR